MAHKVYNKPLIDKLGVKADSIVSVIGVEDKDFWKQLNERLNGMKEFGLKKNSDLIFFSADSDVELKKLKTLKDYLNPDGAIWVVSLKGKQAKIKDVGVIVAGKTAGLVDNKVVGFSGTHTALRLVIPLSRR